MKYDVMVVGAGPAGLVAARIVSSRGFKVAVLERERHLGVKPCGEAASRQTIEDASVSPSTDFISQEVKCAKIHAPNGKSVSIKESAGVGYIMNKALFLQHLAEKAAEEGADIYMNQAVTDLKRGEGVIKVKTTGAEHQSSLIFGADGFASTVSRNLGLEKRGNREIIPCLQYLVANCDLDDLHATEFYLGRDTAPLGYAWIFPKGKKMANVGIGVRGAPAKPYLDKFLKEHRVIFAKARVIGIEAAPVTINGLLEEIVDDNVMLVGEAAGQVIPLTGGGIHSSIVGGKMAGETAVKALEEENLSRNNLMRYVERYNERWGKRIRDSLRVLRVIETLSDDDLNELADILEPQDILDLANGLDIARVGRKFLRHPLFSLKIAKALLSA